MNAERTWLSLLNGATNYSELQNAFELMSVDAQSTDDSEAMIASIDEAIRRIERERARDQTELDGFEADYESFKQEQSGVIGWFKRKIPFTETRKKELGHRDTVSDQHSEVLADNFVIARAQMLKERIAPQNLRRMGNKPENWRDAFLRFESQDSISDYGSVVLELGNELQNTTAFLNALQSDIDSFASARFTSNEDQKLSHHALKAAKDELKILFDESREKQSLKSAALTNLKDLLIADLSAKDSSFQQTNELLANLRSLQKLHPRLVEVLAQCQTTTKSIASKMIERNKLPEQSAKLEQAIQIQKRDYEEAEQKRLRSVKDLETPNQLYQAAMSEWQRADSALKATRSLYDAYLAEQAKRNPSNTAEVDSDGDFDVAGGSGVVAEYRRLEENAAQAKRELDNRTPIFEQTKRSHDRATAEVKELQSKIETHVAELKNITDSLAKLQEQIHREEQTQDSLNLELKDAGQIFLRALNDIHLFGKSHPAVRSLQDVLDHVRGGSVSRSSSIFDNISLPFQTKAYSSVGDSKLAQAKANSGDVKNLGDIEKRSEALEAAMRAIDKLFGECKQEADRLNKSRKETLLRRGQMLLDQRVLSEIDFDESL